MATIDLTTDAAPGDGLEAMSVKALKAEAAARGVSLAGCVEKGEIVAAIRAAPEATEAPAAAPEATEAPAAKRHREASTQPEIKPGSKEHLRRIRNFIRKNIQFISILDGDVADEYSDADDDMGYEAAEVKIVMDKSGRNGVVRITGCQ